MFLFDTDIISHIISKNPSSVLCNRLNEIPPEYQFTTTITVGELIYGAYKNSLKKDVLLEKLSNMVWPNIKVLSFDKPSAYVYGELRAEMERKGTPIGEPDLRIAAIELSQ